MIILDRYYYEIERWNELGLQPKQGEEPYIKEGIVYFHGEQCEPIEDKKSFVKLDGKIYRKHDDWFDFNLCPKKEEQPQFIDREYFYHEEQCEPIFIKSWLKKRDLRVDDNIIPVCVKNFKNQERKYYRASDVKPIVYITHVSPPIDSDVLESIYRISVVEKTYRKILDSGHFSRFDFYANRLLLLKEKGIRYAYKNKILKFLGVSKGISIYSNYHYTFHSNYIPNNIKVNNIDFIEETRTKRDPTFRDAMFTLTNIIDYDDFKREKECIACNKKFTIYNKDMKDYHEFYCSEECKIKNNTRKKVFRNLSEIYLPPEFKELMKKRRYV